MSAQRDEDLSLLRGCLEWAETNEDESESWRDAFNNILAMIKHAGGLSSKQRRWVRDVHEKLFDEPHYENAFSAGKVPRGDILKTKTPEVLKKPLPKKPPGRR